MAVGALEVAHCFYVCTGNGTGVVALVLVAEPSGVLVCWRHQLHVHH